MLREAQLSTALDDGALERTVRSLEHADLDFAPGTSFKYSNANYETLGLIVQYVSGQTYERLRATAPLRTARNEEQFCFAE